MKRLSALICAAGMRCAFPAGRTVLAADTAQKCGDNITWRYEQETGLLILEGTGSMYDYDRDGNLAPWTDMSRYRIEHLSVSDGITSIGDCAFHMIGCFEELELPESVSRIGKYAFAMCTSLENAYLPAVNERRCALLIK